MGKNSDPEYENYAKLMQELDKERDLFFAKLQKSCPIFWRANKATHYAIPSVRSGWYDIIYECSCRIEKALEPLQGLITIGMMPYPSQIKEKFGALRFYYDFPHNDLPEEIRKEIDKAIMDAENKSTTVCEYCGSNEAQMRNQTPEGDNRWIKTLCNDCWRKKEKW